MTSHFFRRIGITLKKRRSSRANRIARNKAPSQALAKSSEARRSFASRLHRRDPGLRRGRLWTKTNMTRLYGWAPRGQRIIVKVPQGKWKTATFLAALRNDRIEAPCLFDGPINGERFHAYVEQFLMPTLKPGDVVILDNLGSQKGKGVRKAIRSCRSPPRIPAEILPRPQPDRATLRQAQRLRPKSRAPNARRRLRHNRPRPYDHPAKRMRKLSHRRRLCVSLNAEGSRSPITCPRLADVPGARCQDN
jgi:transposase